MGLIVVEREDVRQLPGPLGGGRGGVETLRVCEAKKPNQGGGSFPGTLAWADQSTSSLSL